MGYSSEKAKTNYVSKHFDHQMFDYTILITSSCVPSKIQKRHKKQMF